MRILRHVLLVVLLLIAGVAIFVVSSQAPVIAGIEPPQRGDFDPALIARGARLAALGDCDGCHTAAGGRPYAGGRPIPTPFGTVYSTNITPAPGSGIGKWSEAAFRRAMRRGIARRGAHLYPAFPYYHFTKVSDDDLHALYAFIMTRQPVDTAPPPNALPFPFDQRWLMTFWNLLFLDRTPLHSDPSHDEQWNRGHYLVAGLGHCGACHTPRNWLGAEKASQTLAGGSSEGWRAPALGAASPAPVPWDMPHLAAYLRHGRAADHGAALGPMREVVRSLRAADDADIDAIAAYLAAAQGEISPARRQRAKEVLARAGQPAPPAPSEGKTAGEALGTALFAGACAGCHTGGSPTLPPHGVDLALSTTVNEPQPTNAIRVVLDGVRPADGRTGPWMPGFAGAFTDDQLVQLLAYVRAHYGSGAPWPDLMTHLHNIRDGKE
ncbi:MAG: c-type cytochrome [Thiohalocapsa sp.]